LQLQIPQSNRQSLTICLTRNSSVDEIGERYSQILITACIYMSSVVTVLFLSCILMPFGLLTASLK